MKKITNFGNFEVSLNIKTPKGEPLTDHQKVLTSKGEVFVSCDKNIVFVEAGADCLCDVFIDFKYWNYSKATDCYINIFLNETKKETQAKIEKGIYKLADLNS